MKNRILLNLGKKDATSPISNFLLVLLMYMLFFRQVYSYRGMPYVTQGKGSIVYEQMSMSNTITALTGLIALFCVLFLFLNTRFVTSGAYLITGVVLMAGVCVWTVLAGFDVGFGQLVYTTTPPWVYVTALMFCVGLNEKLFVLFLKHAKILGILSVILCFVSTLSFFVSHGGNILADCSNLRYYIQGFWLLCICSFFDENTKKPFVYICVIFFAVMSFAFSSRSWLIQSGLWLIVYTYFSQKKKSVAKIVKTMVLAIILAVVAFVIVQRYFPELFDIISEKKSPMETRAFQYTDLFSQTNIWDFIIGKGYSFSYISSLTGEMYSYIDNAYLLMLVRYGLMIGLTYPLIFAIPAFKLRFSKQTMPLVLWLMALGGLSIFCATIMDLKSIAVPIVAGRCMYIACQNEKLKAAERESDNNE